LPGINDDLLQQRMGFQDRSATVFHHPEQTKPGIGLF
jgi:hypothetical protein